ncbi:MAG: biotin--[acetyl-CoA-carboxylase] ligase, partial [Gammaproteobacteria bacterium]|nr:biotin--[acetyl-CoA-carboxylase] ligase [Gammaproteobacteria bacterium]
SMVRLEAFAEVESTNDYLLEQAPPPIRRFRVALADFQTAGRGRMDRRWDAPPGSGLCLSIAYTFQRLPAQVSALTLAIGQALIDGLARSGYCGIKLKWPNDLMAKNRKLGGVLTELRTGGAPTVVVGLGLNVDFATVGGTLPARAIDLRSLGDRPIDRVLLTATVIECLHSCIAGFERDGFAQWFDRWPEYDWLRDQQVRVDTGNGAMEGIAAGIDRDGAMLVLADSRQHRVISGSVVPVADANP